MTEFHVLKRTIVRNAVIVPSDDAGSTWVGSEHWRRL